MRDKLCIKVGNNEYITRCNFAGRINKAKKPGLKRVKIETMYRRSRGNVKVELLSTSTNFNFFFSLQVGLKLLLAKYRFKSGDSFPPGTSELH